MTKEPKKNRINFTPQQKNEFAKLIVEKGYTTKQQGKRVSFRQF